jgi:uncharacterized membrane protein YfcA
VVLGLLMLAGGATAGFFGSLLGLGGGVLIVPLLTLGFGLPLRESVAVSLVCVIMTSSAAAGVYLERHVANLRLGMTLELFTALGAIVGGSIAFLVEERLISVLFAALLVYTAFSMARARRPAAVEEAAMDDVLAAPPREPHEGRDRLSGDGYRVRNLGGGVIGAGIAGVVSALLGIGGGTVKVPLMHLAMGVPLRVATATSNLMMGVTAAASSVIYVLHGGIDPYVAGPTAIGVFLGATAGSRVSHRVPVNVLRLLFVVVLGYTAIQMLQRGLA